MSPNRATQRITNDAGYLELIFGTSGSVHTRDNVSMMGPVLELVIVSNSQERSPLTNDAVTQTTFNLPFIVAKTLVLP